MEPPTHSRGEPWPHVSGNGALRGGIARALPLVERLEEPPLALAEIHLRPGRPRLGKVADNGEDLIDEGHPCELTRPRPSGCASPSPRLRRIALAALVVAAGPNNGWTPERRAQLAAFQADPSVEVAAPAAWVFPPVGDPAAPDHSP